MPDFRSAFPASRLLLAAACAGAAFGAPAGFAQGTMPAIAPPALTPEAAATPATRPADPLIVAPPPATVPAMAGQIGSTTQPVAGTITQAFVGSVTADKVYVRAGAGTAYYELGQLGKGDLVYVVGVSQGWYRVLPPDGTYCLIAKEFVDADPSGTSGTVKSDHINVRAGTALNKARDLAVLCVVRQGTKLRILGSSDKYYEIAPPENAGVFISSQFVKPSTSTYQVPALKLPAGISGPSNTVSAPTAPPTVTIEGGSTGGTIYLTPGPGAGGGDTATVNLQPPPLLPPGPGEGATPEKVPVPVPTVTYSETATQKFNDLNTRYQAENRKPIAQQNVDDLLKEYKALLATENLAPSVKLGSESRVAALEKTATIQRMIRDSAASDQTLTKERQALQEQYSTAEKLIAEYQRASPFVAEGMLQSSSVVKGKYALVNPATGRVIAYVDPQAPVDISTLVGKYVGLRGTSSKMENSDITVIKVANATLLPPPATAPSP